uniref:Uncharacterized protein n=1 Tax=Romanomermis culicivorax TaxID=13658 RepID=A0A915IM29_ROMCU
MSYTKIEDGIAKGVPAGQECAEKHKSAPFNGKMWYVATKPVTNPSRTNCTNNESFQGGYVAVHQMPGWTYTPYPQVLDYNYAQDFIFPIKDQMFMFVYSRFDGFYFYGLYYFCPDSKQWKDATMQKFGEYSAARDVDYSVVHCCPGDHSAAYVVLIGRSTDQLKVFEFKRNEQWKNYVEMTAICTIDNATGFVNPHFLNACIRGRKIYCLVGTSDEGGNVTSWDQTQCIEICLDGKTSTKKDVAGPNGAFPAFPYGPTACVHDGNQKWVILGGLTSENAYSRDVWYLDLDAMSWVRTCQPIPDELESSQLTASQIDGVLFLADKNYIFNYPMSNYAPIVPSAGP